MITMNFNNHNADRPKNQTVEIEDSDVNKLENLMSKFFNLAYDYLDESGNNINIERVYFNYADVNDIFSGDLLNTIHEIEKIIKKHNEHFVFNFTADVCLHKVEGQNDNTK